ncbi:UvrD-helicase domain-containing protein [Paraburkholderia phenazinium]|uniref:DNA 3'-5' helicase n=1 Tax=Paraburkholderia phenazinium TaxID=60549 RepID=A0A1G7U5Y6_9BURK|nr:UvrD-helicase domain-containing protein [Paraburkholderia phenazinium]SDG42469.1 DNA helicase-4 [Paraburkholderia phenazinium]
MISFSPGWWGRLVAGVSQWTIVLNSPESEINEADGSRRRVAVAAIESARILPKWFWATIVIDFHGEEFALAGLTRKNASALVKSAANLEQQRKTGLERELRRKYAEVLPHMRALDSELTILTQRNRYIRDYDVHVLLDTVRLHVAHLPVTSALLDKWPFADDVRYDKTRSRVLEISEMVKPPHTGVHKWNADYVKREMADPHWIDFFQQVEKSELTEEQQEAVVIHEDRNRLVAAAGSGKSSTLVAKVGYAIQKGYVDSQEVLALAFNDKAAEEIRIRLADRLGISIRAQTFHSLGNSIIRDVTGQKTRPEVGSRQLMQKVVTELRTSDSSFLSRWLLFKAVHWESEPEMEFDDVESYEAFIRSKGRNEGEPEKWGIPTLQGDPVKSFEELSIANWLYVHGVQYRYESPYEHSVTEHGWRKYEPDFMYVLPDGRRLYHEHFALRGDGTSPFGESYVRSSASKRQLHAACGTILIETSSAQFKDGSIFTYLHDTLSSYGVVFSPRSSEELQQRLKDRNDLDLIKLMLTIISHSKESGHSEGHIKRQAKHQTNLVRALAFVDLLVPVWQAYDSRLHDELNSIDFADMIGMAATYVEEKRYPSRAKLILVDEFQDISPGRARLVKALLAQHPDSVLFAVGDDWQAINRFAGSDLSIMRSFDEHFGKTETRYLSKTFRSNQGISTVAARFVAKNLTQIPKKVLADNKESRGVIRIVEYSGDAGLLECIETKIRELAALAVERKQVITILLLGRYRYETTGPVTEAQVDKWNQQYSGRIEIKKKLTNKEKPSEPLDTVHKSKGLEADFVIVHSLQAKWYAFPSEMEDDPLLGLSFTGRETFEYAEERRLFYVALTRAREQVTLLMSSKEPSRFVLELLDKEYDGAVVFEGKHDKPRRCDVCKQGYMTPRIGRRGPFFGCTRFSSAQCFNTADTIY